LRERIPQCLVDGFKFRGAEHEPADPADLGALGAGRERPRDRRTAEQRDEVAALQSIELHLQPLAREAA
jgi:hypothetical protein